MLVTWSRGCTQAQLRELERIDVRVEEANAPEREAERRACFLRRLNLKKRRIELHERLLDDDFGRDRDLSSVDGSEDESASQSHGAEGAPSAGNSAVHRLGADASGSRPAAAAQEPGRSYPEPEQTACADPGEDILDLL